MKRIKNYSQLFFQLLIGGSFSYSKRNHRNFLHGLLMILILFTTIAKASDLYQPTFLVVTINQQKIPGIKTFLQNKSAGILAKISDLKSWRLKFTPQHIVKYNGESYLALSDIPHLFYNLNSANLAIDIKAPASMFDQSNLNIDQGILHQPKRSNQGIFLNYDFLGNKVLNEKSLNGLFNVNYFNQLGTGQFNDLVTQNNNHFTSTRLATTWEIDFPDKMKSLRLGDNLTNPGVWGNSVGFAGIQWATDFATQPNFNTFPLPRAAGEAVVPSTLNVYVNNALVASQAVPVGPFDIEAIPTVNGQGDISLVTTDILGRQRTVEIPYYMSSSLLKKGLNDYSIAAGFIREDFGIRSNQYGRFILNATDTKGITNNFTAQFHTELLRQQQAIGGGGLFVIPKLGFFTIALAGSHAIHRGFGSLLLFRFNHQQQQFSYGVNNEFTTKKFMQVGLGQNEFAPVMQNEFFIGYTLPQKIGTLGATFTNAVNRDSPNAHLFSMNYDTNLGSNIFLSITGITNIGGQDSKAIFANITLSFANDKSVAVGMTARHKGSGGTVEFSKYLPEGNGIGYSVYANAGNNHEVQGNFAWQHDDGTLNAEIDKENSQTSYQIDAAGSVIYLGGHAYFSRQINDSFAVIQVPGYRGVGVLENNQIVTHTDSYGDALVPNLIAYEDNRIQLNVENLPLDAAVSTLRTNIVPYYRSGVLVKFDVKPARAAIITIVTKHNQPIPTDAKVTIVGQQKLFPVGYNGEVYLTGLNQTNKLQIKWLQHQCELIIHYPGTTPILPDLGKHYCD